MKAFKAEQSSYVVKVNSRQLVNWILLEYLKFDQSQAHAMVRLIDKFEKLPRHEFSVAAGALLSPSQASAGTVTQLVDIIKAKTLSELPLPAQQHPAAKQLGRLMQMLLASDAKSIIYDASLMRGFDYYTDIVFEVFDNHPENNRSIFGGGRYDGLVGVFGVEPVPTVGFGMGDVTLQKFLEGHKLMPKLVTETDAVVVLIGDVYQATQKTLTKFRDEGVRLAVDSSGRKVDAQIKSAVKAGIGYALFIGEHEIKQQRYKLKNLGSGEEKELAFERVVSELVRRHSAKSEF